MSTIAEYEQRPAPAIWTEAADGRVCLTVELAGEDRVLMVLRPEQSAALRRRLEALEDTARRQVRDRAIREGVG